MSQDTVAYFYAFSSVFTFSIAAIGFTYFAQKVSPLWMNIFKCLVSFAISFPLILFFYEQVFWSFEQAWPFYLSGFIGLNIGDLLLLSAYKRIGPARTLMLFGLQPLIAGGFAYLYWGEALYPIQLVAIIFFIACLFLFSYERFVTYKQWEFEGLMFALAGVVLDSIGVIFTRYGFNQSPELSGFEVQYMRTLAALLGFVIFVPFVKINFFEKFFSLNRKEKMIATTSSVFGTFVCLVFYMQAIKLGKLAAVTSITLTDPLMSTTFESIWLKKWPSKYLWAGLACFVMAMFFLFHPKIFGVS